MKKRVGLSSVDNNKLLQAKYRDKGIELQDNQMQLMFKQFEEFKKNLEDFAMKYKSEIRKNSHFRKQFQDMCTVIGVDPLSSRKGFWSVLGIGNFYYELAVQIIEVCLSTIHKNGGLICLDELRKRLIKARGQNRRHEDISNDDLLRASKKLRIFGSGFSVYPIGNGNYLVQSVPGELSMDHTILLQDVGTSNKSHTSVQSLQKRLGWERERAQKVLSSMVKEGLAWVDIQKAQETLYWFPSLFYPCITSGMVEVK